MAVVGVNIAAAGSTPGQRPPTLGSALRSLKILPLRTHGSVTALHGPVLLPDSTLPRALASGNAPGHVLGAAAREEKKPSAQAPAQSPLAGSFNAVFTRRIARLAARFMGKPSLSASRNNFDGADLAQYTSQESGPAGTKKTRSRGPDSHSDRDKELLELRGAAEKDIIRIMRDKLGGALGRADVFRHVNGMLKRLTVSNGMDPGTVRLHLGSSFIPNGFTTTTNAENDFLKKHGSVTAAFGSSDIFLAHGLIEAFRGQPDATLAFVLAHEMAHNRLGHLKSSFSSVAMLGHLLEFEADAEALKMIARAGYDPRQALNSLELIKAQVEKIKKKYSLLDRQYSESYRLRARWADIHPPNALRRAHMENYLAEAIELYKTSPQKSHRTDRLAKIAEAVERRPLRSGIIRLEKSLAGIIQGEPSIYEKIVSLEKIIIGKIYLVKKKSVLSGTNPAAPHIRLEDQLVIENAFRELAARSESLQDLNNLHQMYHRIKSSYEGINFPSEKVLRRIIARQIVKVRELNGINAPIESLQEFVGDVSVMATQRLFISHLNRVHSRAELESALEFFGNQAFALGFIPGTIEPAVAKRLAHVLLKKSMALAADPEAAPDEKLAQAIEHLQSKVPATLLQSLHYPPPSNLSTHLKSEAIDLFFTRKMGKTPHWSLLDIISLLNGKSRSQILSAKDKNALYSDIKADADGVMEAWNKRYFTSLHPDASNPEKPQLVYEKVRLNDIDIPDAARLMEILSALPYKGKKINWAGNFTIMKVPETIVAAILKKDPHWQEDFWESAAEWLLKDYAERRRFSDSQAPFEKGLERLSELQISVVSSSRGLAPLTAVLKGTKRALAKIESADAGTQSSRTRSKIADALITEIINKHAPSQINAARNSPGGILQEELDDLTRTVLELDADFASYSTTERLRTLSSVLYFATTHDKDITSLASYVRYFYRQTGRFSWVSVDAHELSRANRRIFKAAGLSSEFHKLPFDMRKTLASGALGLMASPESTTKQLLGASLALYFKHQKMDYDYAFTTDQSLSFLLLEEATRRIHSQDDARAAVDFIAHIHDLDPLYLSYVARFNTRVKSKLHDQDMREMIRTELLGAIAAQRQPFRDRDAPIIRGLLEAIKRHGAWPQKTQTRLTLLDWAGRIGDFDPETDNEIIRLAREDPAGFKAWSRRDRRWTGSMKKGVFDGMKEKILYRIERVLDMPRDSLKLPELSPVPLRIIRNPIKRAELYRILIKNENFHETRPHSHVKGRRDPLGLLKAYWNARKYVRKEFLSRVVRESSPDSRIVMVLGEVSRVAEERTRAAEKRWDSGTWSREDAATLAPEKPEEQEERRFLFRKPPMLIGTRWQSLSRKEKDELLKKYYAGVHQKAFEAIRTLADKYSSFSIPELGFILDAFPEPNRTRDDLLEELAKAKRLSPERMGIIEGYKSYRYPNPLRVFEKQLFEAAGVKLERLAPKERVDLILHLAEATPLSKARRRVLEEKMMSGEEERFTQETLKIYSFDQFLNYLDQTHPADRELFVKSMFFGEHSISKEPAEVARLFRSLAIAGRGLPPLVENILTTLYDVWTPEERIKVITNLLRDSKRGSGITGPEVVRAALKSSGITGAKIAQVLATHKGLLPEEYAAACKSFKDEAQQIEKFKVLKILEAKLSRLDPEGLKAADPEGLRRRRDELMRTADHLYPGLRFKRKRKYVAEILALERIKGDGGVISDLKEIGRELGSGSIKIVYKVVLKDGSVWAAKLRRPGATVDVTREFEIIETVTKKLMADPNLRLPNLEQLMEEVKALVLAELDFFEEADKIRKTSANAGSRTQLENRLKAGGAIIVPEVHPRHVQEDILLEEFIPSVQFKHLPERSVFTASKRGLAKAIVDEAFQALILDEYLDPDRHTGNILQKSWLAVLGALGPVKPVWIDLGQSVGISIDTSRPLLRAGLALKYGEPGAAAAMLTDIFALGLDQSRQELSGILRSSLDRDSASRDLMGSLVDAIMKAESERYIVKAEYAALQKAMIYINGYSKYLPEGYFTRSIQRAIFLRILRENPRAVPKLIWRSIKEKLGGERAYPLLLFELNRLKPSAGRPARRS